MKKNILLFIAMLITVLSTVTIYNWVTASFHLDYNMFSDEFNLSLVFIDFVIWAAIFIPILYVLKKLFKIKE